LLITNTAIREELGKQEKGPGPYG